MDPVGFSVLLAGAFFLAFGLAAYRHFFAVLGAAAGLAIWVALSDTLVRLPGLREHPGTAGILVLVFLVLAGIFLASRYRRVLAFVGGVASGLILSQTFSSFMADGSMTGVFKLNRVDAMDVLVGLVCGLMFLLFERVFAVLLTSVVGSFLCSWAMGGKWTFLVCLVIGLVAQPLVFIRFKTTRAPPQGKDQTGSTTLVSILMLCLVPTPAAADWVVERVNPSVSRAVVAAGFRDGIKKGENYAIIDEDGVMVAAITIGEVFSSSSYSLAITNEDLKLISPGMRIVIMEDYEFGRAIKLGGESRLQDFIHKYPTSRHRKEVMEALDETRFALAEMSGTIEAYREFQSMYPTSRFGAKARMKEEELAFERAWDTGTEEAFRDFLNRFRGTSLVSGISEVRAYLNARQTGKVYAYQDFLAAYPRGRLAGQFVPYIDEFEVWAEQLEFGSDPVGAMRHFGDLGDETAVPFLVGKLNVKDLEDEARKAISMIGEPALDTLMEVLISPLQSTVLKDKVALIIAGMGEISTFPALRTYAQEENTPGGRKALLMLEEKIGR